ncbi:MAG: hypothetical protein HY001_00410 [Candidatus Portnoybacteria bacterium]|nr:hypothetical protein [Candidatus Portnoybacteria bacterium]
MAKFGSCPLVKRRRLVDKFLDHPSKFLCRCLSWGKGMILIVLWEPTEDIDVVKRVEEHGGREVPVEVLERGLIILDIVEGNFGRLLSLESHGGYQGTFWNLAYGGMK